MSSPVVHLHHLGLRYKLCLHVGEGSANSGSSTFDGHRQPRHQDSPGIACGRDAQLNGVEGLGGALVVDRAIGCCPGQRVRSAVGALARQCPRVAAPRYVAGFENKALAAELGKVVGDFQGFGGWHYTPRCNRHLPV